MPDRVLRQELLDSERVAQLSGDEERMYTRLLLLVDDYGRFDARPVLIRARAFPMQLETVSEADVAQWVDAIERATLLRRYVVDGKTFLQLTPWKNKPRAKVSRWPGPPADVRTCEQMQTRADTCAQMFAHVPETETVFETETETECETGEARTRVPQETTTVPGVTLLMAPIPEPFELTPEMAARAGARGCKDPPAAFRKFSAHFRSRAGDKRSWSCDWPGAKWDEWMENHDLYGCACQKAKPKPPVNLYEQEMARKRARGFA